MTESKSQLRNEIARLRKLTRVAQVGALMLIVAIIAYGIVILSGNFDILILVPFSTSLMFIAVTIISNSYRAKRIRVYELLLDPGLRSVSEISSRAEIQEEVVSRIITTTLERGKLIGEFDGETFTPSDQMYE